METSAHTHMHTNDRKAGINYIETLILRAPDRLRGAGFVEHDE